VRDHPCPECGTLLRDGDASPCPGCGRSGGGNSGGLAFGLALARLVLWLLFATAAAFATAAVTSAASYGSVADDHARALRAAAMVGMAYAFCRGLDLAAGALEAMARAARR
jgi:hypothetical protein